MSTLPDSIARVGQEIVTYYAGNYAAGSPPYIVYVYHPKEEYGLRRDLTNLQFWLQSRNITPVAISLAQLLWQAIDESGFGDQIVAEERQGPPDPAILGNVNMAVSQILLGQPTLADRVITDIGEPAPRSAAFLYRAGALYPAFRTSALLDDLRERLPLPVVLLYPGRVVGLYGLSFMGRCDPAHGYRATIIARESR